MKTKVLFVCIHNSARSQMAEAWVNHLCGDFFAAQSAGLEAGTLNPLVIEAMADAGIDFPKGHTNRVRCAPVEPALRLRHHGLRCGECGEVPDFPEHGAEAPLELP